MSLYLNIQTSNLNIGGGGRDRILGGFIIVICNIVNQHEMEVAAYLTNIF